MIATIIFGLLGGALCALAHKKRGTAFFELWTELFGDASETAIEKFIGWVKDNKRSKALVKTLETLFPEGKQEELAEKIKIIRAELQDVEKIPLLGSSKKEKKQNEKSGDTRWIVALSDETLRGMDIESYFKRSKTFCDFSEEQQKALVEFAKVAVEIYRMQYVAATDAEKKVLASIIIDTIKASQKEQYEELKGHIDAALAFIKNGKGKISYQGILNERYAPKYVLNACPECGYSGDRIYVDQKNNLTHCAACGQSYSVVKYSDPEFYQRVKADVEQGLTDLQDALEKKIQGVGSAVEKSGSSLKKEVLAAKDEVKGLGGKLDQGKKEITQTFKEQLEAMKASLAQELRRGAEGVVTQEYLTQFVQTESSALKDSVDKSAADAAVAAVKSYLVGVEDKAAEILGAQAQQGEATRVAFLEALREQNEQIEKDTTILSEKIGLLGERIEKMYDLALEKFGEQEENLEAIRTLVENGVQKGFLDERLHGFESRMTAILSALKEEYDRRVNGGALTVEKRGEILQEIIRSENYKVLGEIGTIKMILERMENDQRLFVKKIMQRNDETLVTAMADALDMDKSALLRLYGGGIPDKYLYDQNWGGEFNCPYCGALEARVINRMQQCRCSACGQIYYAVDLVHAPEDDSRDLPTILREDFGKDVESDPFFATKARVKEWRERHMIEFSPSAESNKVIVIFKEDTEKDHIAILPNNLPWDKKWVFRDYRPQVVQVLVVLSINGIPTGHHKDNFETIVKQFSLKTVVLYSEKQKGTMDAAISRSLTYYFNHTERRK